MSLAERIAGALGGSEAEPIEVPASGSVRVARRSLVFAEGDLAALPAGTGPAYTSEGVVRVGDWSGHAELAVARLLRLAGWSAYWRDNYRGGWVADSDATLSRRKDIPGFAGASLVRQVTAARGGRSAGCW